MNTEKYMDNRLMYRLATALLFIAIISMAIWLRFNKLSENPPGFYADEASIGYNAYNIIRSGRDEHGAWMPLFFEAFGEYKNAFAVYPVVITMYFLGPTELAVRFTHALWGVFDVVAIFFLAKLIWDVKTGLMVAGILATAPWHVSLSRFMIESHNMLLLFVIIGTYYALLTFKKYNFSHSLISAICLGLSFYTYFASRAFTPFYVFGLWRVDGSLVKRIFREQKRDFYLIVTVFLIISIPFIWHVFSGKGLERFKQVSMVEGQKLNMSLLNKTIRLYYDHYAPSFVFLDGDSGFSGQTNLRHSVLGVGLMFKWQLPFLLLGLGLILRDVKNNKAYRAVILMLILYPLGSLVSNTKTPLATRSVIGVIPYSLAIGYGIVSFFSILKTMGIQMFFRRGLAVIILLAWCFYLNRYLQLSKAYMNRAYGYSGFQYGAKEIVKYFQGRQKDYDALILGRGFDGGQAYIDFFSLGECKNCYAGDQWLEDPSRRKLIAVESGAMEEFNKWYTGEIEKTIYYPDNREAFYIMDTRSKQR